MPYYGVTFRCTSYNSKVIKWFISKRFSIIFCWNRLMLVVTYDFFSLWPLFRDMFNVHPLVLNIEAWNATQEYKIYVWIGTSLNTNFMGNSKHYSRDIILHWKLFESMFSGAIEYCMSRIFCSYHILSSIIFRMIVSSKHALEHMGWGFILN